jgi:hypothetical protein
MSTKFAAIVVVSLFISVYGLPLLGQSLGDTTGTLTGITKDESGIALPGALITLTSATGTRSVTTDQFGTFIFPYVIPGTHIVKAELQGFSTIEQTDVTVSLGHRTEIVFVMKSGIQETLTVQGAPVIDPTSTTTGMNITDEMYLNLPMGRSFIDAIDLAPGVAESGLRGNPSISGASGLENTYIIDGVNITNPGFGAISSFAIFYGSLGSGFPIDFIDEVQVKTAGFEPEFGEALGGVVNVITKTGSNQFRGTVYSYFTPLEGEREQLDFQESLTTNVDDRDVIEGGVELSGPFLKDKLFFYGAYNPRRISTTFSNDPNAPEAEAFPETTNTRITHSYAAKLTSNITTNHALEFSVFGDPSDSDQGFQDGFGLTFTDPELVLLGLHFGSNSQTGRWAGILTSSMFIEAQFARTYVSLQETLSEQGNQWRYRDRTGPVIIDSGGIGGHLQNFGTNLQYNLKLTNVWKTHQFGYGLQYQDIDYSGGQFLIFSGPTFTAFNGQQTSTGALINIRPGRFIGRPDLEKVYIANSFFAELPAPSTTAYLNWFVQDSWNLTSFLNLKIGIRWERQQMKGRTQNSEEITFSNNWAPRFGATYDYLRNGKSKAYFHYGRFYEKIPNELASSAFTQSAFVQSAFFDAALTQPIPDTGIITVIGPFEVEGHGLSTSSFKAKSQFSDEWVIGADQEIRNGFSLGARFIYRTVGRVLEDIYVNLDAVCVPLSDGTCVAPGLTAEEYLSGVNYKPFLANLDGHYPVFPELSRDYKALELTFEKRLMQNWLILGSYRYAHLTGNYEGLYHRESDQSAPNVTLTADFANSPLLGFAYDEGPLPNDIRHSVKIFGSYQWEIGITAGIGLRFQSGRPISNFSAFTPYSYASLPTPRGSKGRTDSVSSIDIHADYNIHLGSSHDTITLGVDIFNLFNSQAAVEVQEISDIDGFPNADFLKPIQFQDPRSIRFLMRFSF